MTELKEKPTVKLSDPDGNAFSIIGRVKNALLKAGADNKYVDKYQNEATSGNYYHLVMVTLEYVHAT